MRLESFATVSEYQQLIVNNNVCLCSIYKACLFMLNYALGLSTNRSNILKLRR
jgi:hypothetical protein